MADYNINEIIQQVKAAILAESQGVGEVPVVTSLEGVNSLPALKGNQVVEAPLELLAQPAEDAATQVYDAIADAEDTANHPTYVGTDNYVYIWNKGTKAYDKTSIYVRGEGFKISKTYASVNEMNADTNHGLKEGDFVLINTNDVENPDNAKIYVVNKSGKFVFLVDMSGAIGFTGKTPQFSIGTITIGVNRADASVSLSANGTDSDGNPRYKLNIKIPSVQLSDLTEAEIALLQKPANDMIAQLKATDSSVKTAEAARVTAENERKTSESARKSAETARATAESERSSNETTRISNENSRKTNENTRISNETNRESAETKREQAKAAILALNEELKTHPPRINDNDNWEIWDAVNKVYNDTGITAQGKSPIIQSGTWWVWDDSKDSFVNTGQSVNTDFVLERENVETVLGGIPAFYVEEWKHTSVPFRSGSVVKFNQEFYSALKDTSLPPVDLLLLSEGIIAKVDEHTYATKGSYDAEGNKDDWKKIPHDELRLSSRYGTLNGEEVDVRTLATAEEVYQLEPNLYIDMVKGVIKGKKVDFKLPKKNVTDALGYTPASTAQHEALASEVQKQGVRLDSLESNALVSTYTLEQSSNPAFEVSNKNAAKLYASQMGGYLFYNGNSDGKVYAAKLNPYDWGKLADGTPVTEAIEAATETMVHVPDCHFKAEGKTMHFGGIIPIDGGHTFGSPHWVGAYLGSIADGALHSRPNVSPSYSQTMESFWNYAQALHANKEYGLANYQFHCLINALFQASFGNLNSQEVIGAGWQSSSWGVARDVKMGLLRTLGDGSGNVLYNDATLGNQYPTKLFGIEDIWGKMWEFRSGIRFEMRDGVRYAIVYDGNQVNNAAEGREFVTALQSANGAYVTSMKLGEWWDIIPEATQGGGEALYYCDGAWVSNQGNILYVGARANNESRCGLTCPYSKDGFSYSHTDTGARLSFWGEPEIVSGAQLVAMINTVPTE